MTERRRRFVFVVAVALAIVGGVFLSALQNGYFNRAQPPAPATRQNLASTPAIKELGKLAVRAAAPHTGYSRDQFGSGWRDTGACDMRNRILQRDLTDAKMQSETDCTVLTGTLHDPYTSKTITFERGAGTSAKVQIDHVVALSNAWQTGAQELDEATRIQLANDPLELLAVDGPANQQKSDADASEWLPPNKSFRCSYVARQIAVKLKYHLWVTPAEQGAMQTTLAHCPAQLIPST